jgi:hypothetical protein
MSKMGTHARILSIGIFIMAVLHTQLMRMRSTMMIYFYALHSPNTLCKRVEYDWL